MGDWTASIWGVRSGRGEAAGAPARGDARGDDGAYGAVSEEPPPARQGQDDVWAAYGPMAERLRRVAYNVLRDEHEAEDAVHDAMVLAHARIGDLRDPRRFEGWLLRIARNAAATRARKRQRCSPGGSLTDDDGEGQESRDPRLPRVTTRFGSREPAPPDVASVREGIEALTPVLLACFRARYQFGRTLRDIAAEQGVSVACVKTRLTRVAGRLRASI